MARNSYEHVGSQNFRVDHYRRKKSNPWPAIIIVTLIILAGIGSATKSKASEGSPIQGATGTAFVSP